MAITTVCPHKNGIETNSTQSLEPNRIFLSLELISSILIAIFFVLSMIEGCLSPSCGITVIACISLFLSMVSLSLSLLLVFLSVKQYHKTAYIPESQTIPSNNFKAVVKPSNYNRNYFTDKKGPFPRKIFSLQLTPKNIPFLEEKKLRSKEIVQQSMIKTTKSFTSQIDQALNLLDISPLLYNLIPLTTQLRICSQALSHVQNDYSDFISENNDFKTVVLRCKDATSLFQKAAQQSQELLSEELTNICKLADKLRLDNVTMYRIDSGHINGRTTSLKESCKMIKEITHVLKTFNDLSKESSSDQEEQKEKGEGEKDESKQQSN